MEKIIEKAQTLWTFLSPEYATPQSDFLLVLGSHDTSVPSFAAEFWKKGLADYIVVSGGLGKMTKEKWAVSEARNFTDIMIKRGVPEEKIFLEEKATNTGENITLTRSLIKKLNLPARSGIIITKPYMKRRAFNTASRQWPEVSWSVTAEAITFGDYLEQQEDPDSFIQVMVGDLQRIKVYAEKGFQVKDDIPKEVWESYEQLVEAGYDRFVIKIE